MQCYNCCKILTKEQNHKEHIPPKNLFHGFPNSYRQNRIIVPACYECNQSFSYIDEEFRNLIGIINKQPQAVKLVEKTMKSLFRLNSKLARIIYNISSRKPYAVEFENKIIEKFHIKNFKGIYYFNYSSPLPTSFKILAHFDKNFKKETSKKLINYLTKNFQWKVSGHENVFKYIIQPFRNNHIFDGNDIVPKPDEKYFLAIISYTNNHAALILAERCD